MAKTSRKHAQDQFRVVRNNMVIKMLEQAKRIQDAAKAVKTAKTASELVNRLVDVQYRCADTVQQAGGRIDHVLLVVEQNPDVGQIT